ncbi:Uma2 family endonuclease [Tsukamurella sp. NPDC003166]|uniref:Uma2 family endonuclease n=1 Tax=Tsukamurella sp. NPDC003166 TaxID=3154444 RepID=UPI0033B79210
MTAAPDPALLTLEDWFALGEDESLRRAEVCRGVLEVSPSPRPEHSDALLSIAGQLRAQVSHRQFRVLHELDVILDGGTRPTVRQPDVLILRAGAAAPITARDVLLAIEILSPTSLQRDRWTKRAEYAAAGIPNYWIIDLDGPSAEVLTLVDGRYEGSVVTERIQVDGDLPLVVDLADLQR